MAKLESMWASSSEDEDTNEKAQPFAQKHSQNNQKKNSFSNRKNSGSWQNSSTQRNNLKSTNHRSESFSNQKKKNNKNSSNFNNEKIKQNPLAAALGLNLAELQAKREGSSDSSEYETTDDERDTFDSRNGTSHKTLAERLGKPINANNRSKTGTTKDENIKIKNKKTPVSNGSATSVESTSQLSKVDLLKKKIAEQKKILEKTHEKKKIMDSIDMLTKDLDWDAEEIDISKIKI